jgi:hypothetical protein
MLKHIVHGKQLLKRRPLLLSGVLASEVTTRRWSKATMKKTLQRGGGRWRKTGKEPLLKLCKLAPLTHLDL